jgi:hypothetical protein
MKGAFHIGIYESRVSKQWVEVTQEKIDAIIAHFESGNRNGYQMDELTVGILRGAAGHDVALRTAAEVIALYEYSSGDPVWEDDFETTNLGVTILVEEITP